MAGESYGVSSKLRCFHESVAILTFRFLGPLHTFIRIRCLRPERNAEGSRNDPNQSEICHDRHVLAANRA